MPSQTAGRRRRQTTRRRSHRRRGGAGASSYSISQDKDTGKWYIIQDGRKLDSPYDSFEQAKSKVDTWEGIVKAMDGDLQGARGAVELAYMKRGGLRGGAYEIKQEGDKWYIHEDGEKQPLPFDSFSAAKKYVDGLKNPFRSTEEIEVMKPASALTQMKKGGRKTRRHSRR